MNVTPKSLRYDDVNVGDELPPLDVPLTRTLIVATAIASRDYQDVHHDPRLAHDKGSKDIFMNILTTNGFVGRFVTDWAGPNAVLKAVRIRLGAPNYPGDTMHLTGSVIRKDGGVIELAIKGSNSLGDHVTGTVELALPDTPINWSADGSTRDRKADTTARKDARAEKKKAKKAKKKDKKDKKGRR